MKNIRLWKKGKKFEVKIIDSFTGESIIIDNDFTSKYPLTIKDYLKIEKVKEIMESNKPLHNYSIQ